MTTITTYSICFSGDLANCLAGLGHQVTGQTVGAASRSDAMRLARIVLGDAMVAIRTEDGTYCYRDRESADDDQTGDMALAVITREEV
jgi:hypothetical protein